MSDINKKIIPPPAPSHPEGTSDDTTSPIIYFAGFPPDPHAIKKSISQLVCVLNEFEDAWGIDVEFGETDFCDVVIAYSRDIYKLCEVDKVPPDSFKQAGYMAFWIKKLKPLFTFKPVSSETSGKEYDKKMEKFVQAYLNELFAAWLAHLLIKVGQGYPDDSPKVEAMKNQIVKNIRFLHDIRYGFQSPSTLSVYFHLICEGSYPDTEKSLPFYLHRL